MSPPTNNWSKDELNIVLMWKLQRTSQHGRSGGRRRVVMWIIIKDEPLYK
jgi:hypothetical protein